MFKLSQGPVQFLGLFLAAEQKNSFETAQILEPFWFFVWAGNMTRERLLAIGSIILHRKLGQKKMHFVAECR